MQGDYSVSIFRLLFSNTNKERSRSTSTTDSWKLNTEAIYNTLSPISTYKGSEERNGGEK